MSFCKWVGCECYVEGNTEYCGTHNHMLRKMKREDAKEPKPRKEIRKVAPAMAKKLVVYGEKKKIHMEKHPDCQAKLLGCTNHNNTVHHSAGRGSNLNKESTFITVCDHCHSQIHDVMSAAELRKIGLKK